jgi:hypothetical protein
MNNFTVECSQVDENTMSVLLKLNVVSFKWAREQLGLEKAPAEREPCNAEKFILAIED